VEGQGAAGGVAAWRAVLPIPVESRVVLYSPDNGRDRKPDPEQ